MNNTSIKRLILLVAVILCLCSCHQNVTTSHLRLEMKDNPDGISVMHPRFSWKISSSVPDLVQLGYRIQVAGSERDLKKEKDLMWDSGEKDSGRSILVPYGGRTLCSEAVYYWRVKIRTNQGETGWSKPQRWSMTMLDQHEWKARWIGEKGQINEDGVMGDQPRKETHTRLAARYLRKEFKVEKKIGRAVLYISGLGSYEAYLNGERISDDVFAPMPSYYPETVYYNVYDVTDLLDGQENTLGVILGNGRYFGMRAYDRMLTFGFPSLLAELHIWYEDGTAANIISDGSWKVTSKGPIIANNEFDGEEYDARMELKGWNLNGYDDSGWKTAEMMDAPEGKLTAQQNANICVQETVRPIAITERPDGKYMVDMGQNMVGWLQIKGKGKAGRPVSLSFAEKLKEDGSLFRANLRSAEATDRYTPANEEEFSWEPSFVYHGFRFVEIAGLAGKPELSDLEGKVVYDRMESTSHFETSDPLVNQIHKNAFWGIRGNYRGMPTDCPQRDERLGWLGDRATGAFGEAFMFDNALLYNKWLKDVEDSMDPEGRISDVSPRYWTLYRDNVTWPAAFFCIAEMVYRHFGDDRSIKERYPAMKQWMQYVTEHLLKDGIIQKDRYGDWCVPPESQEMIHSSDPARKTDGKLLGTSFFFDLLRRMSRFAVISGHPSDAAEYLALSEEVKAAYNKEFFHPENGQYGNNTVTANLVSLWLGLVPEEYEDRVFQNVVDKTEGQCGSHVSTGLIGIQFLMRGLTRYGRPDLAYKILTQRSYPSWGYMIGQGATTIWELWNGDTAHPSMNSGNHVMLLGDLMIWYYEDLAGIKNAEGSIAYKKLKMNPVFPEGLDHVDADYESVYGRIHSEWTRKGDAFRWEITVPGNTTADIYIPRAFGVKVKQEAGIHSTTEEGEYMVVKAGSGSYIFQNSSFD